MMKIAAYIDESGSVSSFDRPGAVRLFDREETGWVEQDRIEIDFTEQPALAARKAVLRDLAARLGTCRVLLLSEVTGILTAILQEELGFRIWRSEGALDDQLDSVAAHEAEAAKPKPVLVPIPVSPLPFPAGGGCSGRRPGASSAATAAWSGAPITAETVGLPEDGRLRIDLAACLTSTPGLNSRDALIPILTGPPFRSLEILCDHPPRWLDQTASALGLIAAIEAAPDGGVRVTVSRREAL